MLFEHGFNLTMLKMSPDFLNNVTQERTATFANAFVP